MNIKLYLNRKNCIVFPTKLESQIETQLFALGARWAHGKKGMRYYKDIRYKDKWGLYFVEYGDITYSSYIMNTKEEAIKHAHDLNLEEKLYFTLIDHSLEEELTLNTEDEQVCDKEGNIYMVFKITEHKDSKEIHVHTNRGEIIYKSLDEANRKLFCV